MIRKITIINFRAIKELTIAFKPFTMLIGENSSGKSTVLQALDFLCSITQRDIDEYLKDRDWDFDEIKSQFASKDDKIHFITELDISGKSLAWDISINYIQERWLIQESISDRKTGDCYLSYGRESPDMPSDFSQFDIKSSALKMLDMNKSATGEAKFEPVLAKMKGFLSSSNSFELLSPEKMRSRGSLGKVNDIGMGGEKLAAFIHGMPPHKKAELYKLVSELTGYNIKISTSTTGQPGWVEMYLVEAWEKREIKIKKRYISDGLLRIIAFSAILISQESKKTGLMQLVHEAGDIKGLILLDEIEDGINPALSEKLIERFKIYTEEMHRQMVISSHSPVAVNAVGESDVQFMWRDSSGIIRAKPLFCTKEMKELLEFLGPGEVWLNYSKDEIVNKLSDAREAYHDQDSSML